MLTERIGLEERCQLYCSDVWVELLTTTDPSFVQGFSCKAGSLARIILVLCHISFYTNLQLLTLLCRVWENKKQIQREGQVPNPWLGVEAKFESAIPLFVCYKQQNSSTLNSPVSAVGWHTWAPSRIWMVIWCGVSLDNFGGFILICPLGSVSGGWW